MKSEELESECAEVRSTAGRRGIQETGADEIGAQNVNLLYLTFVFCQVIYDKWFIFWEIAERSARALAEIPAIGLRGAASRVKIAACKLW